MCGTQFICPTHSSPIEGYGGDLDVCYREGGSATVIHGVGQRTMPLKSSASGMRVQ